MLATEQAVELYDEKIPTAAGALAKSMDDFGGFRDAEVASLVLRRVTRDEVATIGVPTLTRKVLVATGFGETPGAARRAPKPTGTDRRARAPRRSRKSPAEDR